MSPSNFVLEAEFTANTLGGVFIVSTSFLVACITPMSPQDGVEVPAMVPPL